MVAVADESRRSDDVVVCKSWENGETERTGLTSRHAYNPGGEESPSFRVAYISIQLVTKCNLHV